jgi:Protein of unknown function (DUF2971)
MPPDYLYKYTPLRAPTDEQRQRKLDALLLTPKLWFSAPASFNDPMDCKPGFTFEGGTPQLHEEFRRTVILRKIREDHPNILGDQIGALIPEYTNQYSHFNESLCRLGHTLLSKDFRNNVGVLCLSECERDPVMFNHYGDGHRGMCLKFRSLNFFAHAEPVQYGMDYPVVNYFDDANKVKQFGKIFLAKYLGWKYEQEWRIVNFEQDPTQRLTSYPTELLEGVIFGYLMPQHDRDYATDLLRRRGGNVMLYEAKVNDRHYLLDIELLESLKND